MAITLLNDFGVGDTNFTTMMNTINKSYKGKADITLSNYDNDSAPVVKVGSIFEDNGALFIVDTSDITPSGYAGIANSTIFYLYFDESATAFIYDSTTPTWSDALQGWYSENDRALFSMYKDSGGTLYQTKNKMQQASNLLTKIIPIGDWDMDALVSATIPHGLTDLNRIKTVTALIRRDDGLASYILNGMFSAASSALDGGVSEINSTNVILFRFTTGFFDSNLFDSTSYNRGWITIEYVE